MLKRLLEKLGVLKPRDPIVMVQRPELVESGENRDRVLMHTSPNIHGIASCPESIKPLDLNNKNNLVDISGSLRESLEEIANSGESCSSCFSNHGGKGDVSVSEENSLPRHNGQKPKF